MGAQTASAVITVPVRRRGLPQHRGQTPNQQSEGRHPSRRPGFRAIPLAKIPNIRHGKRYGNHTVTVPVTISAGRTLCSGESAMSDDESGQIPRETLADARGGKNAGQLSRGPNRGGGQTKPGFERGRLRNGEG